MRFAPLCTRPHTPPVRGGRPELVLCRGNYMGFRWGPPPRILPEASGQALAQECNLEQKEAFDFIRTSAKRF